MGETVRMVIYGTEALYMQERSRAARSAGKPSNSGECAVRVKDLERAKGKCLFL